MTKYYNSNALYDCLDQNPINRLQFPKGEIWPLVYGDKKTFEPIVLVLAVGRKQKNEDLTEVDKHWRLLSEVGKKANVPVCKVEFNTRNPSITKVQFSTVPGNEKVITLEELKKIFKKFNLPVTNAKIDKAINDKSSSAYQNWQRKALGNKIIVTDIDIYKIDTTANAIESFYELKRSYKSLDVWQPYLCDYNNFKLMSKLAKKCGANFHIVYNRRETNPFNDDISLLKVYDVDFSRNKPVTKKGQFLWNDFLKM